MPQAPTVNGPTGQASRIDQAIIQQRAANQAGGDMRYDTYEYTELSRNEMGDGLFSFDTYIPEQKDISITELPEVMRAFGEQQLEITGGRTSVVAGFYCTTLAIESLKKDL